MTQVVLKQTLTSFPSEVFPFLLVRSTPVLRETKRWKGEKKLSSKAKPKHPKYLFSPKIFCVEGNKERKVFKFYSNLIPSSAFNRLRTCFLRSKMIFNEVFTSRMTSLNKMRMGTLFVCVCRLLKNLLWFPWSSGLHGEPTWIKLTTLETRLVGKCLPEILRLGSSKVWEIFLGQLSQVYKTQEISNSRSQSPWWSKWKDKFALQRSFLCPRSWMKFFFWTNWIETWRNSWGDNNEALRMKIIFIARSDERTWTGGWMGSY